MNTGHKVLLNTAVLYLKILITMLISLVSVPLVLKALGKSDYGLYNLIAGVISMLAFLNSSMSISTQRFLSVAIGTKNLDRLDTVYNVAIGLHLLLGFIIVLLFEVCFLFVFDGFLNIEPQRLYVAKIVYQCLVISTFFTILSVPYGAVMNAKEDMVVFSIIYIVDSICKLLLALALLNCSLDRLMVYGIGMASISILNTIACRLYVKVKYHEFKRDIKQFFNRRAIREMGAFAGWNTIGAVAIIGRNQGIAIIINHFFGTIANAAYGIANQVNGVLVDLSSTFQKTLNPQLMQSEGMNDRERLVTISFMLTKSSVLVLALFGVPLLMEMQYVLKLWLHDVPEYTLRLTQLVLILNIIYQFSVGTISSIQAVGNVKLYFIITSTLVLLNIPISYYLLRCGMPLYETIVVFIIVEGICFIARLLMAKRYVGFRISEYFKQVFFPVVLCIIVSAILPLIFHYILRESFGRLLIVCISYAALYLLLTWKYLLEDVVRNTIKNLCTRVFQK